MLFLLNGFLKDKWTYGITFNSTYSMGN